MTDVRDDVPSWRAFGSPHIKAFPACAFDVITTMQEKIIEAHNNRVSDFLNFINHPILGSDLHEAI
ncbi:MAG: hypothetical protein SA339_09770 [Methanomassiliicoccus sp.]|nr:hypothetical protein [Methanomassiliicoccus sp.]